MGTALIGSYVLVQNHLECVVTNLSYGSGGQRGQTNYRVSKKVGNIITVIV